MQKALLFMPLLLSVLLCQAAEPDVLARGAVLSGAGACLLCHTPPDQPEDGPAGGRALKTAFGTFYSSNITPDPETGIGRWTRADFHRALRSGRSPSGHAYWPAFPYPAFSGMASADLDALYDYLMSLPPVRRTSPPHALKGLYRLPGIPAAWQRFFFRPAEAPALPPLESTLLGRYLAEHVGHCGECHTPRTPWGTLKRSSTWSGAPYGDSGKRAPDIRQNTTTGIGGWSESELLDFLESGSDPEGSPTAGVMAEIVEQGIRPLSQAEKQALVRYMLTVH